MLFYLAPSVAKKLNTNCQETFDFVVRLLDSRKRGLLLVHASQSTFSSIVLFFIQHNRIHEAELTSTLAKSFREKRQIIKDLTRYVYVTDLANGAISLRGRLIVVSPKSLNRTNMLYPPVILGENLTDCELYVNAIAGNYNADLPVSIRNLKLADRFEGGGGNSTHVAYRRYKDKKIDLCFCIVDSDRKCPDESFGDTAKFVTLVDKTTRSALCSHLVIDMYSAENLLPMAELQRQYYIGKSQAQLKEFDRVKAIRSENSWRYLPLKKGIQGSDLKKSNAHASYWSNEISKLGIPLPCCANNDCDCNIVPVLGAKTLANALAKGAMAWSKTLNQEPNIDLRGTYLRISTELKSWLCVGKPIRL
jgi:hypothetical protein